MIQEKIILFNQSCDETKISLIKNPKMTSKLLASIMKGIFTKICLDQDNYNESKKLKNEIKGKI